MFSVKWKVVFLIGVVVFAILQSVWSFVQDQQDNKRGLTPPEDPGKKIPHVRITSNPSGARVTLDWGDGIVPEVLGTTPLMFISDEALLKRVDKFRQGVERTRPDKALFKRIMQDGLPTFRFQRLGWVEQWQPDFGTQIPYETFSPNKNVEMYPTLGPLSYALAYPLFATALMSAAGAGLLAWRDLRGRKKAPADVAEDASATGVQSENARVAEGKSENALTTGGLEGSVIGRRYEVRSRIGEGSQGSVYRGWDILLGRAVAVKFLSEGGDETSMGRFTREVRNLSRLVHDHIVRYYDSVEHEGRPVLIMEVVEGSNLRDVLADMRARQVAPSDLLRFVVEVAIQICDALAHAHGHALKIVHRDVKPENILLARNDTGGWIVKVSDFGLSRRSADATNVTKTMAELTAKDSFIGTPAYVSPEQICGQPPSPSMDLYSLGVVLFEAIAGRHPFADGGDNLMTLITDHLHKDPPSFQEMDETLAVPQALEAIVRRLMEKVPGKRYSSADDLKHDLVCVLKRLDDPTVGAESHKVADA